MEFLRSSARCILVGTFVVGAIAPSQALTRPHSELTLGGNAKEVLGSLPSTFEENRGQLDPSVRFLFRTTGYQLFLTNREAVMVLQGPSNQKGQSGRLSAKDEREEVVVRMRFDGSNEAPAVTGVQPLGFKTNYFIGADTSRYITDIPNHARVKYTSVYPGIDLLYYENQQRLEYDFLVAPHAKPEKINLSFAGADKVSISRKGDLVLNTALGDVTFHKPVAYQEIQGKRKSVKAKYLLANNGQISFGLGRYDVSKPLVIDPIVSYSSHAWGEVTGVAVDAAGNAYIGGSTQGTDLPATNGYRTSIVGYTDAYVAKLNPSGSQVVYATYLGARRATTNGNSIAIDAAGNAYIAGTTSSSAYPVTSGAYQTTYTTGASFVTKLNATGNALVYSTFVNGATIKSVALDGSANLYMTGNATAIATTSGVFQGTIPSSSSPFVAKLNSTGTAMAYATYLGGSGSDEGNSIAVDSSGNAYVAGVARSSDFPTANPYQSALRGLEDAFVTKLNPTGTALTYSTYLGGSEYELGNSIAVNASGQAFVVGQTHSNDFPVTPGVFQPQKGYQGYRISNGFITKFSDSGTGLVYSSFLGGSACSGCRSAYQDNDTALAVAIDSADYVYVGGRARSPAFPSTDRIQDYELRTDGEGSWPFIAKITPLGNQKIYSVLLGVNSSYEKFVTGIAADPNGNAYAVGQLGYGSPVTHPSTAGAVKMISGDFNRSFILKLSAGKYPTTVTVQPALNPDPNSQSITFTATVLSTTPDGTVTFMNGGNAVGSVPVVDGAANFTLNLSPGVHKITAVYSGDSKESPPYYYELHAK
jgi:hypothetical protein